MADIRIQQPVPVQATPVSGDSRGGGGHRDQSPPRERPDRHGAEELAVALAGDGRAAMEAHYEQDPAGNPLIRIVDTARGETVAVVTPEELRALTEHIGLPPGLLLRTSK
jgi:hypothetical protein